MTVRRPGGKLNLFETSQEVHPPNLQEPPCLSF
jgi:hypothetical protein